MLAVPLSITTAANNANARRHRERRLRTRPGRTRSGADATVPRVWDTSIHAYRRVHKMIRGPYVLDRRDQGPQHACLALGQPRRRSAASSDRIGVHLRVIPDALSRTAAKNETAG